MHFADGVGGDDRSDFLFADGERHLGDQAVDPNACYAPCKLIASADLSKPRTPFKNLLLFGGAIQVLVNFVFRDAVMAASRLDGPNLLLVNPSLEGGIADS